MLLALESTDDGALEYARQHYAELGRAIEDIAVERASRRGPGAPEYVGEVVARVFERMKGWEG